MDTHGNIIANNWAGLTSGTLTTGIAYNETGNAAANATWTNVAIDGTASFSGSSTTQNCAAWTVGTLSDHGYIGQAGSNTSTWTHMLSASLCNATASLYCFQQDGGAGCLGPVGNEGDYIYNGTSHVYQYCDGAVWRQMQ